VTHGRTNLQRRAVLAAAMGMVVTVLDALARRYRPGGRECGARLKMQSVALRQPPLQRSGPAPAAIWPGYRDSSSVAFSWWPPATGTPDRYNVYRDGELLYSGVLADSNVGGGSKPQGWYCDVDLQSSMSHTYYVTAVTAGVESEPSSALTMTTLAGGGTPTTLPAAVTDPATWIVPYSLPSGTVWTATNTASFNAAGTGKHNASGCGLQYALTNATAGDVIVLTAGATYDTPLSGWRVPAYTGSSWVYVISSQDPGYNSQGTLPRYSYSTRYGGENYLLPANVSSMPTLLYGRGGGNGITIAAGCKNVRFVGINVQPVPHVSPPPGYCVIFQNSQYHNHQTSADGIYFDRCMFGNDTASPAYTAVTHGIGAINCDHFLAHQCYFWGMSSSEQDSNAIFALGGGPHCIQNCYIEAVGEGILYGGGYVDQYQIPHDITYRYNYNTKLAAWQSLPTFGNYVKNHFELKCAERVNCYGNIHQNNWSGRGSQGQHGVSFGIGSKDQQQVASKADIWGTCPWVHVSDVDLHDNLIFNVNRGVGFVMGDNSASGHTSTLRVANNLIFINPAYAGDFMRALACSGTCTDLTIDHNTVIINMTSPNNYGPQASLWNVAFGSGAGGYGNPMPYTPHGFSRCADRATITNNIFDGVQAVMIDGGDWAKAWGPHLTWSKNLTINDGARYPATTYARVPYASIGFASWRGNTEPPAHPSDWNVTSGRYSTASTTGGPIGATL
jgi:hypothetical protein